MAVFIYRNPKMKRIAVIGNGNVASHIIESLSNNGGNFEYVGNFSRSIKTPLPIAEIYIVAVSDDAIKIVTEALPENALVLHTSGTKSINETANRIKHRGVLYPLQTFSKEVEIDMKAVPFFIECNCVEDIPIVEELALTLGSKVTYTDSEKRKVIHIAAVFSCNFTNHLYAIAQKILKEKGLEFSILEPLIKESIRKMLSAESISDIQTGPAQRHDYKTIKEHEKMLSQKNHEIEKIYNNITNSIIKNGKF